MYMIVWKWKNYWHRIEISQGLGLGGEAWGNFLGDITVLHLDCINIHILVVISYSISMEDSS